MPRKRSRLASVLEQFAQDYELPYNIDGSDTKFTIGITHKDKLIGAIYQLDALDDKYEFGASLGRPKTADISTFSSRVLTSDPIRGLTERIISDKFMVLGGRTNLQFLNDDALKRCYMDDIARISAYYDQIRSQLRDE